MAFSHLCWQLSHLGRGEAVLSTQCGGQDALARFVCSLCGYTPLRPGETEAWRPSVAQPLTPWVPSTQPPGLLYEWEDNLGPTHHVGLLWGDNL